MFTKLTIVFALAALVLAAASPLKFSDAPKLELNEYNIDSSDLLPSHGTKRSGKLDQFDATVNVHGKVPNIPIIGPNFSQETAFGQTTETFGTQSTWHDEGTTPWPITETTPENQSDEEIEEIINNIEELLAQLDEILARKLQFKTLKTEAQYYKNNPYFNNQELFKQSKIPVDSSAVEEYASKHYENNPFFNAKIIPAIFVRSKFDTNEGEQQTNTYFQKNQTKAGVTNSGYHTYDETSTSLVKKVTPEEVFADTKKYYKNNPFFDSKVIPTLFLKNKFRASPTTADVSSTTPSTAKTTYEKNPYFSEDTKLEQGFWTKSQEQAKYAFSTDVQDQIHGSNLQRNEVRDGNNVKGFYSYSDGYYKRTVHYEADENGYRVVKEEVEPIGEGPVYNPKGQAIVRSSVGGTQVKYTVSGNDFLPSNTATEKHIEV